MSVIAGAIGLKPGAMIPPGSVDRMLQAMRRPSDDNSNFDVHKSEVDGIAVGRLASGYDAQQGVMASDNADSHQIFFIGDLYNDDLAHPDNAAQYLLNRYRSLGVKRFCHGLNGSFAAVILDRANRSIVIVTDHTASHAIYFVIVNDIFYFASEMKAMAAIQAIRLKIDPVSIISLIARGHMFAGRSLAAGVQQIPYASIVVARYAEGLYGYRYWRYRFRPEQCSLEEAEERVRLALRRAVERQTRRGTSVLFLTGGLDSRAIAACLSGSSQVSALTYTARSPLHRHKLGDSNVGKRVAEVAGMAFHLLHYDPSDFESSLRKSVVLSDGAAGFVREDIWRSVRKITGADAIIFGDQCLTGVIGEQKLHSLLAQMRLQPISQRPELASCLKSSVIDEWLPLEWRACMQLLSNKESEPASAIYLLNELYFEQRLVFKINAQRRLAYQHGFAVRNPWLDLDLMNEVLRLPAKYVKGKVVFQRMMSGLHPELASLPRAREPEDIDYRSILKAAQDSSHAVSRLILDGNPFVDEVFESGEVAKLIDRLADESVNRRNSYRRRLLASIPMGLRLRLRAIAIDVLKWKRPTPQSEILLRYAIASMALRHMAELGSDGFAAYTSSGEIANQIPNL